MTTQTLLTVLETAETMGVSTRTVRRYLRSGKLTTVRTPPSRRIYVRAEEVSEALRRAREERHAQRPEVHPE